MKFDVGDIVIADEQFEGTVICPGEHTTHVDFGRVLPGYDNVTGNVLEFYNDRLKVVSKKIQETIRGSLLLEAKKLVEGDRNVTHGSATENFTTIAKLWSTQLSGKLKEDIAPHEVAQMMIHLKLARMRTSPDNKDHWLDLAGYASLGFEATQ